MRTKVAIGALAATLVLAAPAAGQTPARTNVVTASGGYMMPQEASALKDAFIGTVDVLWALNDGLSLGPSLFVARMNTNGDLFPPVEMDFGQGETHLYTFSEGVTAIGYGITARYTLPGTLSPFVEVGGGGYSLFLDAQKNDGPKIMSGARAEAGAGVRYGLAENFGIQVEARDHVFFDYKRDELFPVEARFWSDEFASAHPAPPEAKSTIHNIVVNLGFTYVPGSR